MNKLKCWAICGMLVLTLPAVGEERKPDPDVKIGHTWTSRETVVLSPSLTKAVLRDSFRVSPDGGRFSWVLSKSSGQVVAVDGVEQPAVYLKVHDSRFSDDGKDFAVGASVENEEGFGFTHRIERRPVVVLNNNRNTLSAFVSHDIDSKSKEFNGDLPVTKLLSVGGGSVAYYRRHPARLQGTEFLSI